MQEPGALSDGTPITYASGLHCEHFHGLPFLEHSGHIWGFQSDLLQFPVQHLTVVILANTDDCDAAALAFSVAEIYLKDAFAKPPGKPKAITIRPAWVERYVGTYEVAAGTTLRAPGKRLVFRREDFLGDHAQLAASSKTDFFALRGDFRVSFVPATDGGPSTRAIVHQPSGDDFVARRVSPPAPTPPFSARPPTEMAAYTGRYYSEELDVLYTVTLRDGKLWMRYPRGELEMLPQSLDTCLWSQNPTETVAFARDANGSVSGFLITEQGSRVQNLRFVKVRLNATSATQPGEGIAVNHPGASRCTRRPLARVPDNTKTIATRFMPFPMFATSVSETCPPVAVKSAVRPGSHCLDRGEAIIHKSPSWPALSICTTIRPWFRCGAASL